MEITIKKHHYNKDGKLIRLDLKGPTGKSQIDIVSTSVLKIRLTMGDNLYEIPAESVRDREMISHHWASLLSNQDQPGKVDEAFRQRVLSFLNLFAKDWSK